MRVMLLALRRMREEKKKKEEEEVEVCTPALTDLEDVKHLSASLTPFLLFLQLFTGTFIDSGEEEEEEEEEDALN